tara:strand:+ start:2368 stop:3327 length:960 start_codon:yes stop_codon:yes gene_type:complete
VSSIIKLDSVLNHPKVCLAIGNFDGVHLGHQVLLQKIRDRASSEKHQSWVLTFEPHPQILFQGSSYKLLQTYEQKYESILAQNLDGIFVAKFDSKFSEQSPLDFLQYLHQTLDLQAIQVGYDFRFGKAGAGDAQLMKKFFSKYDIPVEITHRQQNEGTTYSSKNLRQAIKTGDTEYYLKTAGRFFSIRGQVVAGSQRGRKIGFPTANIIPPENQVQLSPGVYAVKCCYNQKILVGLANLGKAPTFNKYVHQLEAYFYNFKGNLYGEILDIQFIQQIREVKQFDSIEELRNQIESDLAWFKEHIMPQYEGMDCTAETEGV